MRAHSMDISNMKYLYYRGYAKDCNYACSYCPFAKNAQNKKALDETYLNKFVTYIENTIVHAPLSIMFTPYGEALTKQYYYDALTRLSNCEHVACVSCQTNASFEPNQLLDFFAQHGANLDKIALWASFHKDMISVDAFAKKIISLSDKITLSVGAIGFKEHQSEIERLRSLLPLDIYLWINKPEGTSAQPMDWSYIDPLYPLEDRAVKCDTTHCNAGIDSIFIKEKGDVYLCHSSKKRLGNLYEPVTIDRTQSGRCHCYLTYCHKTDNSIPPLIHRQQRYYQKRRPKAVFFDIDGTLITKDKNYLSRLKGLSRHYAVYFVTGRSYDNAMKLCRSSGVNQGVFGYGAYIKTPHTSLVTYLQCVPTNYKQSSRSIPTPTSNEKVIEEDGIYHLVHNSVSKLIGMNHICKEMQYHHEDIWVVGNGAHDAEILANFPYSFAVKNAHSSAIKSASITLHIEEILTLLERIPHHPK